MEGINKIRWKKIFRFAGCMVMLLCVMLAGKVETKAAALTGVSNVHQTGDDESYWKIEWDMDLNAIGYDMQYSLDGSSWSQSKYITLSQNQTIGVYGLNAGKTYYVRLRSFDKIVPWKYIPTGDSEFSDWSEPIEVVTAPKAVTNLKQTSGTKDSITATWEASVGATKYKVCYLMGGSEFPAGETQETAFTVEKLDPDTRYDIRVYPVRESAAGYEAVGKICSSSMYTTSPKVKNLSLKRWETKTNEVTVEWDSVSGYPSGYEVLVTDFNGKKLKNFKTTGSQTSFKLSSIKNKGFIFKVRAYKDVDGTTVSGDWSGSKIVVAQPGVKLKRIDAKSIQISWGKITGASSYTVYRSTNLYTGYKKIKTTKSTKLINKGLSKNKTYYYYVVANGIKVNKNLYKSTSASQREIAWLSDKGVRYDYMN